MPPFLVGAPHARREEPKDGIGHHRAGAGTPGTLPAPDRRPLHLAPCSASVDKSHSPASLLPGIGA